jgi:hypothetical protein
MENWILNLFGFVYMIISELQAPKVGRLLTPELMISCFGVRIQSDHSSHAIDITWFEIYTYRSFSKRKFFRFSIIFMCGCGPNMTRIYKLLTKCPDA